MHQFPGKVDDAVPLEPRSTTESRPTTPLILEQFSYRLVCRWNCLQNAAVTRLVPAALCVIRRRESVNADLM